MFKKLGVVIAAIAAIGLTSAANAQNAADIVIPTIIHTPNLLDLSSSDLVIGFDGSNGGDFMRTTVTLDLIQDSKGKLVGKATLNSSKPVQGKPAITFPLDIQVTGKVKSGAYTIKGKLRQTGGADFHSRTVGLSISGRMFPGSSQLIVPIDSEYNSNVALANSVSITGIGNSYSFSATVLHKERQWFGIKERLDTTGMKPLPANTKYFEVSYPHGYDIVAGNVQVINGDSVLSFKSSGISGTVTESGGNGLSPLYPTQVYLKTKTGIENLTNPDFTFANFIIVEE